MLVVGVPLEELLTITICSPLLLLPSSIGESLLPLLLRRLLLPLRLALPLRLRLSQLSDMSNDSHNTVVLSTQQVLPRSPETKGLSRHKQIAMPIEFKKGGRETRIENAPWTRALPSQGVVIMRLQSQPQLAKAAASGKIACMMAKGTYA